MRKYFTTLAIILLVGFAVIGGYVGATWLVTGKLPDFLTQYLPGLSKPESRNILLMGTDGSNERTDVMMLLMINAEQDRIDLVSIPRDTRVNYEGDYVKINSVSEYGGVEDLMKTITSITGVNIDSYMSITFEGFRNVIDILGGVDFDVPEDMYYEDPYQDLYIDLAAGQQHLDGKKAEMVVRYRGYPNADLARIGVQQSFLKALYEQNLNAGLIAKAPALIPEMIQSTKTDLSIAQISSYIPMGQSLVNDDLQTHSLPGDSQYIDELSFFIVDQSQTNALISEIQSYVRPVETGTPANN